MLFISFGGSRHLYSQTRRATVRSSKLHQILAAETVDGFHLHWLDLAWFSLLNGRQTSGPAGRCRKLFRYIPTWHRNFLEGVKANRGHHRRRRRIQLVGALRRSTRDSGSQSLIARKSWPHSVASFGKAGRFHRLCPMGHRQSCVPALSARFEALQICVDNSVLSDAKLGGGYKLRLHGGLARVPRLRAQQRYGDRHVKAPLRIFEVRQESVRMRAKGPGGSPPGAKNVHLLAGSGDGMVMFSCFDPSTRT